MNIDTFPCTNDSNDLESQPITKFVSLPEMSDLDILSVFAGALILLVFVGVLIWCAKKTDL